MKRLFVNVLIVVLLAIGFSSSLLATEVDAAAKSYTTQTDVNKVYFPWYEEFDKTINLPINYKNGVMDGKTYYATEPILVDCKIEDIKYTLEFDKKLVTVKTYVDNNQTHLLIKPIKVGKTTVKVKVSKNGFNTLTRNIVVNVSKSGSKLTTSYDTTKNLYTKEYKSTSSNILKEYNKLYLYMLNVERSKTKLTTLVSASKFELKLREETIKIVNKTPKTPKTLGELSTNSELQELAVSRYKQLNKLNGLDDHDGIEVLLEKYPEYYRFGIAETLAEIGTGRYPDRLIRGYKGSAGHWAALTNYSFNAVGSVTFKAKSGKIINVTLPGTDASEEMYASMLDLDYKYMHLMTPEEKEYYGYDDYDAQTLELDSKENYEESDVLDEFDKIEEYEWSI